MWCGIGREVRRIRLLSPLLMHFLDVLCLAKGVANLVIALCIRKLIREEVFSRQGLASECTAKMRSSRNR